MLDGAKDFRRLVTFVASSGREVAPFVAPRVVRSIARHRDPSASRSAMRARTVRRGSFAAALIGSALVLTTSVGLAMQRVYGEGASDSRNGDTFAAVGTRSVGSDAARAK
jgi:hypothetical protein